MSPPPDFFFKNGAIWCILGSILAVMSLIILRLIFFNVAFADKPEKENNEP